MDNIRQLKEQMTTALKAMRDICEEADQAKRDFTADERVKLDRYETEVNELKAKIQQAEGVADLRKRMNDINDLFLVQATRPTKGMRAGRGKTFGEQVINSEGFQAWMKQYAPGGHIPESLTNFGSPPIEIPGLLKSLGRKELIVGADDDSAGAFVETDYTRIYEPLGRRELTLLDLIPRGTTTSDTVSWVRQMVQAAQAAPTPEANVHDYTGATGEESGEKPEATIRWDPVTETVRCIPVWVPATRRALADVGQLRSLIDQDLRGDCEEELEDQIADGDGAGENFTGILNTAGILEYAFDTDVFRTARLAKTYVMTTGRARPNAWVLNPEDWATIELTQDGDDRYYYGGPASNGEKKLWGVDVVESEAIPQGTGLLGDFRKAKLWDREATTIRMTDSHEGNFTKNIIVILAELRAAFGLIRPSAFCKVDLEAGS